MKYTELKMGGKTYTDKSEINKILKEKKLAWLIDSEIEHARIEILNDTLIWHGGNFYSGNWRYGIFRGGVFFGTWHGGIFEAGEFEGRWLDGVRL
jgi:hypothetical protein